MRRKAHPAELTAAGTQVTGAAFDSIDAWLKREIGVDAELLGRTSVHTALRRRMTLCSAQDFEDYQKLLDHSALERQALIDTVIVPETWFFRDREAFAAMAAALPTDRVVRLLSLPCSTGEEPYSIAITLLEAGIPLERFWIDAIDISATNLAAARRAVYGSNSFRGGEQKLSSKYFDELPDGGKTPVGAARARVRFGLGNLLDPRLLEGQPRYDVVFCRNVLIYFDRPNQEIALQRLKGLLAPEGLLFVGAAEARLAAMYDFKPVQPLRASAFRKIVPGTVLVGVPDRVSGPAAIPARRTRLPARSYRNRPAPVVATSVLRAASTPPSVQPLDMLDEARRLADRGDLSGAARACEQHLRDHGPSAQYYYLQGLIHDSARTYREAAELYRKALYLDPTHAESLAHLALVLHQLGDVVGARALHMRLRRLSVRDITRDGT